MSYQLIQIHSKEKGASGPRPPGKAVDTLVIHTTDTMGMSRWTSFATMMKYIKWAEDHDDGIDHETATRLREFISGGKEMPDGLRLCTTASYTPAETSWHYCVSSVTQATLVCVGEMVPPELQAHHIGPICPTGNTNKRSIGIENCYPGAVATAPNPKRPQDPWARNIVEAKTIYHGWGWEDDPVLLPDPNGKNRWYVPYPETSFLALRDLCIDLCKRFPIAAICNHWQFAKSKRIDPDPPISLVRLRDEVGKAVGRTLQDMPPR
jgi:hypothetical protein